MSSRIRPGLFFRIRDTALNRAKGLSPHTSKGHIVFLDDDHISVSIVAGRFPEKTWNVKVTRQQFQDHFSIDVFTQPDPQLGQSKHFPSLFFE